MKMPRSRVQAAADATPYVHKLLAGGLHGENDVVRDIGLPIVQPAPA